MRLLQSFKEMEEPFEKTQIGSSAMAYKRNPMRCERITSLARYVMIDSLNPAFTAGTQWFERTLDDSANKRVMKELPFMATENIMMDAVEKGGNRQELHEKIRTYSMVAGKHVKEEGLDNDLCDMLLADPAFMITKEDLDKILKPENFTGRSEQQTEEFVAECIQPILDANKDILGEHFEMKN